MNTFLDIILVRTAPTPTSFIFAMCFWGALTVCVASYLPRLGGWLTDADLDDEYDDDLEFTPIDHGHIR
ncbi:hypothetical protein SEA_RUTHY_48 [Gordonia phage Ruthy]|uniref:Uncharacterized protein n=1 Tax=Gordonia phage Ruthy TaxID=2250323 RepID=A0A345L5F9_9CAUD|nr:hypothetical protein HOT73_gp48 [Gordonia phage Ruthy]AXH50511.1 hypothetical protein SEA_RUTHY_48 [Gordonia phage Ruthy]